jgi:hypothetical protein
MCSLEVGMLQTLWQKVSWKEALLEEDAEDPCPALSSIHGEKESSSWSLSLDTGVLQSELGLVKRMQWDFHSEDLALQNIIIAETVLSLPVILEEKLNDK